MDSAFLAVHAQNHLIGDRELHSSILALIRNWYKNNAWFSNNAIANLLGNNFYKIFLHSKIPSAGSYCLTITTTTKAIIPRKVNIAYEKKIQLYRHHTLLRFLRKIKLTLLSLWGLFKVILNHHKLKNHYKIEPHHWLSDSDKIAPLWT